MAPRTTFANYPDGLQPIPTALDAMFRDAGRLGVIPCTASGSNSITLTPRSVVYAPVVTSGANTYNDNILFSFKAVAASTGSVTVDVGGAGSLKLYRQNGTTQIGSGEIASGTMYLIAYDSALDGGAGGFFLFNSGISTLTLADNAFTLQDNSDATKQLQFQLSGITTGTTRTLTAPDADATLVGTTTTQALTNKTYNGNAWTAGTGTLTFGSGKTLTISNTLTLTGTDGSSVAFGAGGTVAYVANKLSAFAATTSAELAGVISDETGSGALVFGTSPTISAPTITGHPVIEGVTPTGATGTGNMVFSASPTFTGTITAAAANFSGAITFGTSTITGLTNKASPDAANDYAIIYDAAGTAVKKTPLSAIAGAGNVSSIAGNVGAFTLGYGLTNSTNDLRASLTSVTNSLGSDAALNSLVTYTTGPTCAQGTSGTWFACGTVTILNASADTYTAKLWDGTTVIASADVTLGTNARGTLSLSGVLASPAGNIRISVLPASTTTGNIKFNDTGNSKDSTLTVVRIAP